MSNSDNNEQTKDGQLYAGGRMGDGHNVSVGVNDNDEAIILYQDTLGTKIDYGSCEKKRDYFVFIDGCTLTKVYRKLIRENYL